MRTLVLTLLTLVGLALPLRAEVIGNVRYAGVDDAERMMDIYVPEGTGKYPLIVFAHGGGWKSGDKGHGDYSAFAQRYAREGWVVCVVNYRLSPAVRHPTHCQDFAKAVAYVYNNAEKYKANKNLLVIGGYSAGGHIASLVALDPVYLMNENMKTTDIKGVLGVSGVYEITGAINKISSNAFGEGDYQTASPLKYVRAGAPRFLLLTGSKDLALVANQTHAFHNRLAQNRVPARHVICKGATHMAMVEFLVADCIVAELAKFRQELEGH